MEPAITIEDVGTPDVLALLEAHLRFVGGESPPEHVHAFDAEGFRREPVTLYGARRDGVLLGLGALKQLDPRHGEIKSMHVAAAARGQGIARRLLEHLLATARARGYTRVSLETGSMASFAPARELYRSVGFEPCGAFADYTDNAYSTLMTLELDPSPDGAYTTGAPPSAPIG